MNCNQVILVDLEDRPIGVMEKLEAHQKGLLHRAFSVFLINNQNKILLQRRALSKYHSPGLWTNSVCSHQCVDESNEEAAARRLFEELGIEEAPELKDLFTFQYHAQFDNGLQEHEFDHVLFGKYNGYLLPNPDEVAEIKWMEADEISEWLERSPDEFTVWFQLIFERFRKAIRQGDKAIKV
jgi:isopentenyl-diphosphate delta-isomerase